MQGYPLMAGEPRGLPLHFSTLPEHLASLGYRTNLVGKWHQGYHHANYTPTRRGFHHHLGYWNGYMSYFSHSVHMDVDNGLKEVSIRKQSEAAGRVRETKLIGTVLRYCLLSGDYDINTLYVLLPPSVK